VSCAQALLRAKDAEVAAVRAEASASATSAGPSTASLQAEISQLRQLMETAAEVAAQQLRRQAAEHESVLQALEAELSQVCVCRSVRVRV
jgi:uncharacterized protein involved in exopolysaccharide biosynthesis